MISISPDIPYQVVHKSFYYYWACFNKYEFTDQRIRHWFFLSRWQEKAYETKPHFQEPPLHLENGKSLTLYLERQFYGIDA
jgi:starvation-inducible outer membrane lipoprotein